MNAFLRIWLTLLCLVSGRLAAARFTQPDSQAHPNLYLWTDTCNVWVLRDGDAALLINLGDGSVLDHLAEIGVRQVEWILFTDHHREQCQGAPRLEGRGIRIAGPKAERALFEQPSSFRKLKPKLGDAFTVHSASYVRPPIQPIRLDRGFQRLDELAWRGLRLRCEETKGNSPGGMSYLLQVGSRWVAFSGDVMVNDARMNTYFDTEWDYWFDPFWVRAEPYRTILPPGQSATVTLHVRNFLAREQTQRIEFHTPPGLKVEPTFIEATLAPESRRTFPLRVQASATAAPGVYLIGLDVTRDGRRLGEWFDFVVGIEAAPGPQP